MELAPLLPHALVRSAGTQDDGVTGTRDQDQDDVADSPRLPLTTAQARE